jgi:hypothetical protein
LGAIARGPAEADPKGPVIPRWDSVAIGAEGFRSSTLINGERGGQEGTLVVRAAGVLFSRVVT